MGFKNIIVWLLKSIITLIAVSIIFSSTSSDFDKILSESFKDIYTFASPASKEKTLEFLEKGCGSVEDENAVTANEICSNQTLMNSFKASCEEYRSLKEQGKTVKNEQEMEETCSKVESGELERECQKLRSAKVSVDTEAIQNNCRDYKAGKLKGEQFFSNMLTSSFGGVQNIDNPLFQKYNRFIQFMKNNIFTLVIIIAAVFILLYFLERDLAAFLVEVSKICFGIAMTILAPYIIIIAYNAFIGIDTTPVLESVLSGQLSFTSDAIISVVMLMILKTYNSMILNTGIALLIVGIAGKIFVLVRKRKSQQNTGYR
ncbi:hypothetical protein HYU10_01790 [Candidatus Woesearchaeota archaeon]|nr:hypothetical protein [Candidatus Woesearchaeota archaeon]